MTPSESALSKQCKAWIKHLQSKGVPIFGVKIHGGPFQQAGLPDWHVTYYGKSHWIELKKKGKKPTPLQEHTMRKIREAGGVSTWIEEIEEFKAMFSSTTPPPSREMSMGKTANKCCGACRHWGSESPDSKAPVRKCCWSPPPELLQIIPAAFEYKLRGMHRGHGTDCPCYEASHTPPLTQEGESES